MHRYKGTVFPAVFYDFLHRYLLAFVGGAPMSPDQKIMKLDQDFDSICNAYAYSPGARRIRVYYGCGIRELLLIP